MCAPTGWIVTLASASITGELAQESGVWGLTLARFRGRDACARVRLLAGSLHCPEVRCYVSLRLSRRICVSLGDGVSLGFKVRLAP